MRYGRYAGGVVVLLILLRVCLVMYRIYSRSHRNEQPAVAGQMPLSQSFSPEMDANQREAQKRMQDMQGRMNDQMQQQQQRMQQMQQQQM